MRKFARAAIGLAIFGLFASAVLGFAFRWSDATRSERNAIVIGSKQFTESILLAEIIAQVLERDANIRVVRRFNLGGTLFCFRALERGDIDIYPEYTGTGLTAILKAPVERDTLRVREFVRGEFARRFGIQWFEPFGFDNSFALVMKHERAKALNIGTISDLRHRHGLRIGAIEEFLGRADGWPGLVRSYELQQLGRPRTYIAGLMFRALEQGEIDVAVTDATDGRIIARKLTTLDDDRDFFPPYEAAPLVRDAVLRDFPTARNALERLGGVLTNQAMAELNYQVDSGARRPEAVAYEFVAQLLARR